METILVGTAAVFILAGTFFSFISVLGYLRLPDVYTRLHTTGKVSVFGVACMLVSAALWAPVSWGHALVLIFFLLAAGPPTAHAMGSAAHRIGLPRSGAQRDDLGNP